ncbi:transglutaminase-like cysteine peptidase [Sphingosinicella sp. BN140058]|uniref:transglutaminase-like cysteine peptidase n=1 Tax=Sphingosinicella sp. BN140058 TaxID=1892855 RepID=UPI001013B6D3|nr:transglutaminase-like cysteine peptidase [Sphingosinicella sp. BN140058]QAY77491.1 hypothetical protein ETR14_13995 [Sphingosinicella sp. BN140058]
MAAFTITAPAHAAHNPAAFVPAGEIADAPTGFLDLCLREPALCGLNGTPAEMAALRQTVACMPPAGAAPTAIGGEPSAACTDPRRTSLTGNEHGANGATGAIAADGLPEPDREARTKGGWPMKMVRSINSHVNATVRQRTDRESFGVDEYWQPSGTGKRATGDCEDIALQKQQELIAAGLPAERLFLAVVFSSRLGLHTVLVVRGEDGDIVLDSATGAIRPWHKTGYSWLRVQSPEDKLSWRRVAGG